MSWDKWHINPDDLMPSGREPSTLEKDAHGRTILPTTTRLREQLKQIEDAREKERRAQWKQRLWDQR